MLLALAAGAGGQEKTGGRRPLRHHCVAAIRPTGGAPGHRPPLAGNLARHAGSGGGRDYLAQVPLTGMVGAITVNGVRYTGNMPSFAALSDGEIAAVVAYVLQGIQRDRVGGLAQRRVRRPGPEQGGTPTTPTGRGVVWLPPGLMP